MSDNQRVAEVTDALLNRELEIEKTLVLSTAHVPLALAKLMDAGKDIGTSYDLVDYGYIVYCMDNLPPQHDLWPATDLALSHGCKWIRFDADGSVVEGLRVWQW